MAIWFKNYEISDLNKCNDNTLISHLGIEIIQLNEETIVGKMPVTYLHHQPHGILHGGASVVLAESLGSIAANLCIDPDEYYAVGQSIHSNHIKPVKSGDVFGHAQIEHLGKTSQVWNIRILNSEQKLINLSRLTMAVRSKKG